MTGYSRSAIDRASDPLRDFWSARKEIEDPAVLDAIKCMIAYRETFQVPLNKTVMGLRSMVQSQLPELKVKGVSLPVSQRLKREPQIIDKLHRFPEMNLSRMGDIGGGRAILPDRATVDGVAARIRRHWHVKRITDFRDEPQPSGYRAVHAIVERDRRLVEVQLRTPKQHEWALAVERTGQRLRMPLKEGFGPADLIEYFRLASHGLYLEELEQEPDPGFLKEFRAARERARPYFRPA